jgi:hypothetical protein
MKPHFLLTSVLVVAVVAIVIWFSPLKRVKVERVPKVNFQTEAILFAIKLYREQLGVIPTGDSKTVSASLMGQNPNGVVFIEGQGWTNQQGELIDPWGMPYLFSFESNTVTVRSSGPNRISGDTDDVVRKWIVH